MSDDGADPRLIVTVFKDLPGGFLPVGEFAAVHKDLAAAQERLQRMEGMVAVSRALWMVAGFVVGLGCGFVAGLAYGFTLHA